MRNPRSLKLICFVIAVLMMLGFFDVKSTMAAGSTNPRLAEVIKNAARESEIVYQVPDPATGLLTSDMLREMEILTEKLFGVRIRIRLDNALSFPAAVSKTLAEIKAGAPPTFDLMYQTELSGAPLYKEQAIEPIPWIGLFSHITPKDLEWNGLALINTNYGLLPIYNTGSVKPQDVPKAWDDLLDLKWKGKLGAPIYPDPWMILAQPHAWGEQKMFAYLTKLMELKPKLGGYPEVNERVTSGETPMAWLSQRERTLANKQRGVPIDIAERVEPVLVQTTVHFVPKGARHPNAAALVAASTLTKEGQEAQLKYQSLTSMFRPNTPAAQFAAKYKVIRVDVDFMVKNGVDLSKRIAAILIKK